MIGIAIGLVVVATIYDLRVREIPNWIAASLFVTAAAAIIAGLTDLTWTGLVLGAGLGLALTIPLYALGGFGGGDVKLVVALGAALGPLSLLSALFWVAVSGGILAIVAALRGRRDLAYVPAIALGLIVYGIRLELMKHALVS
jgi:prepilin peptidase CpaA